LKGGNGGGVAAKSGGVSRASMSQRGWEVEEGGGVVCASPDGRKLARSRKGVTMVLYAF
jgi:hypothetical protein